MQTRDSKGRFLKGRKLTEVEIRKREEARARTWQAVAEYIDSNPLDERICTRCKEKKDIEQFRTLRYKTKNSGWRERPRSWCKQCEVKRVKAYEKTLSPEKLKEKRRLRDSRRYNKPGAKQKLREDRRMKNALAGKKLRPTTWKNDTSWNEKHYVDVEPFLDWWDGIHPEDRPRYGKDHKLGVAIRRMKSGEYQRISLNTIDEIGCSMGRPDLVSILYPLDE